MIIKHIILTDKEGKIKEDYGYEFYCPTCGELEIGDLLIINDAVLCVYCKSHLGYIWDLPEVVKNILVK